MSNSTFHEVHQQLLALVNPENAAGMARFGIQGKTVMGIKIPVLRDIARKHKKNQQLALELWQSGEHEARILASMVADPKQMTSDLMEIWVHDFDAWDLCDQVCGNLFFQTPYAWEKALAWPHEQAEYVRRAGFSMMVYLAVHGKKIPDDHFLAFFPLIKQYATDERNFVKKAVNWALRQLGKRSDYLHPLAMQCAQEIALLPSKSARWIASDAIRELKEKAQAKATKP